MDDEVFEYHRGPHEEKVSILWADIEKIQFGFGQISIFTNQKKFEIDLADLKHQCRWDIKDLMKRKIRKDRFIVFTPNGE